MLTQRERDTLEFIRTFIAHNGKAPLVSEIAQGLGITSQGTTHRYIQSQVDQVYNDHLPGRIRCLR